MTPEYFEEALNLFTDLFSGYNPIFKYLNISKKEIYEMFYINLNKNDPKNKEER